MALTLAEIRAKLQSAETRGKGNTPAGGDNTIYPHWNIAEGTTASIRFLPDANPKNDFFWVERAMIKLPFNGIKGQADSKPVVVQVPCVEMYNDGSACPILAEVRPWFKNPDLEELGRKYWKKKSYLFQGFVRTNPIGDDKKPENPIRRFIISPQIFNLVKNALMDPELEHTPTDTLHGLDFNVKKTSKGGYADYSTSTWARKETALTSEEQASIDSFGLHNLGDFLPNKPSDVELKIIKEMFEASVDGEAFDMDRWGQYFKPAGMGGSGSQTGENTSTPASTPAQTRATSQAASVDADDDVPFEADNKVETSSGSDASARAQDILAMIRNRQQSN